MAVEEATPVPLTPDYVFRCPMCDGVKLRMLSILAESVATIRDPQARKLKALKMECGVCGILLNREQFERYGKTWQQLHGKPAAEPPARPS